MPTYRVRPGFRHGIGNRYGAGDLVELTEQEAAGFLDKLEPVEDVAGDVLEAANEPAEDEQVAPFDVNSATVQEVTEAVKAGQITVEDALKDEQAGKQRTSLLSWLEAAPEVTK